jgi:MoaA/NifB/PqqE/SkfB family radical SAM enzyme
MTDLAPPIPCPTTPPIGAEAAPRETAAAAAAGRSGSSKPPLWQLALKAIVDGGPATCHFAITSICNARCGFCSFAVDRLPKHAQHSVTLEEANIAAEVLKRNGIHYLIYTGGEPLVHRDFIEMVSHAAGIGMSPMLVTNKRLLADTAADRCTGQRRTILGFDIGRRTVHRGARQEPRSIAGLCDRIREANERFRAPTKSRLQPR